MAEYSPEHDPILQAQLVMKQQERLNRISRGLQSIASKIDHDLDKLALKGEAPVFALFVMVDGAAQYVSNGNREEIKVLMASVLRRWEQPETPTDFFPHHLKTADQIMDDKDNPL